jgi:hypothetical protein
MRGKGPGWRVGADVLVYEHGAYVSCLLGVIRLHRLATICGPQPGRAGPARASGLDARVRVRGRVFEGAVRAFVMRVYCSMRGVCVPVCATVCACACWCACACLPVCDKAHALASAPAPGTSSASGASLRKL